MLILSKHNFGMIWYFMLYFFNCNLVEYRWQ